ncbi:YciC family protein [Candidatus Erwinia dacicola]|uniref:UPF0259 membrane protein ACZ87_02240 n=1 Tax=Candidatus Erwinia dacicola TaxID=252393 RepID=A0A1E7YYJ5_9GAMM|nr:YciC family protein [Candidatus Erwinia dacicola]OFC61572.1 hypothetical protein BBW68_12340 [Candidatus Erwinia dacicola]RAP70913.1 hypothetical protein ACZ87_02276 [Candidatus Erwinia dacicola]RAP70954.1 hypothetical protein ACZ87_02240 [Candidatus Erwinia dacicola]
MSITASSLYRDTGNFFRHQLITIVLMALLTSFITMLIGKALTLGVDDIQILGEGAADSASGLMEMIRNMSPEQQQVLLHASAADTFASLVGNVLLLGGTLSLIPLASSGSGQRISALRAIGASAPRLPALLLVTILMTVLIQLSFMVLVVPGVLLAVTLALSPIILMTEKVRVIAAMRASMRLGWSQMKLIAPAVILWIVAKLVVVLASSLLPDVASVVLNALGNLVSAILIIYLSRLYMLLR